VGMIGSVGMCGSVGMWLWFSSDAVAKLGCYGLFLDLVQWGYVDSVGTCSSGSVGIW
jgi:hypothetical protein